MTSAQCDSGGEKGRLLVELRESGRCSGDSPEAVLYPGQGIGDPTEEGEDVEDPTQPSQQDHLLTCDTYLIHHLRLNRATNMVPGWRLEVEYKALESHDSRKEAEGLGQGKQEDR